MGLAFRTARPDDLERLVDVHASAFPDRRGRDDRARNFTRNPLGNLGDLHLAVSESGEVVAHGFLFSLRAWFGARLVPVGGIASVGVAPEARGRGVASALMAHLQAVSLARGDAVAVLHPFRQGFYARLGYATTTPYRRLRISPASVPWTAELRARPAAGSDRGAMRACWHDMGARRSGTLERSERLWESRFADEATTWLVVEGAAGVEGYVAWTLQQSEPHAATTLAVREMVARTDAAMRSLWSLVGAQRDQVAEARIDVSADDAVEWALLDPDRGRFGDARIEHALGEVAAGPMVRILDVARALEARGYRADGRLELSIGEEALELDVRDGKGSVAAATGAEPNLRLRPAALAAVAFGGLRASQAERLGWLAARDGRSLTLAEALFSMPAYFSPDAF